MQFNIGRVTNLPTLAILLIEVSTAIAQPQHKLADFPIVSIDIRAKDQESAKCAQSRILLKIRVPQRPSVVLNPLRSSISLVPLCLRGENPNPLN
jgi:hypothetical protein